ncbi:MAG: D-alanine--D-alanine ligase [bacterium]
MAKIEQLISKETKIGVLYGGMSNEREVSLRSGKNCYDALLCLGYQNVELIDVDKNVAKNLMDEAIEVAYIALHGKYGEDGCIQGLLEILGIAYTGCGPMASAISMDKHMTKQALCCSGIPLIKSVTLNELSDIKNCIDLKYPVMVKPATEGSSIGMTKVEKPEDLLGAVAKAFECSSSVMIEEFLVGASITIGVLDMNGETIATPILELRPKTEWYDYEAKYTKGMTEFILPAELSSEVTKLSQDYAIKAHKSVMASGMSRVDFLVVDDVPYLLEINTIPGMTDTSDLPAQSAVIGISYNDLVQIILNSATLKKH